MFLTREAAKAQGLKRFFTGESCKRGHIAERMISSGDCHQCVFERKRTHYAAKRGDKYRSRADLAMIHAASTRRCTGCHKEFPNTSEFFAPEHSKAGLTAQCRKCVRAVKHRSVQKHPRPPLTATQREARRKSSRDSARRRYPIVGEAGRKRARQWKKRNREWCREYRLKEDKAKRTFYERNRKARKRHALPVWADLTKIAGFYELAAQKTRETGIEHNVDHIYPIMGKTCCGLHVEYNLRVIAIDDNRSKSNKILPEFDTWAQFGEDLKSALANPNATPSPRVDSRQYS